MQKLVKPLRVRNENWGINETGVLLRRMSIFSKMNLSPRSRMNLVNVLVITTCYTAINVFLVFFTNALLNSSYSLGPSDLFNYELYFTVNIVLGLFIGLLGGTTLVLVNSRLFKKRSFRFALSTTAISYTILFIIAVVISTSLGNLAEGSNAFNLSETLLKSLGLLFTPLIFTYFIMWGIISLFTLFLLQVNDKFGPGVMQKFLRSIYHEAKKQKRIFMFLDMRSSTTIAEKIGNEKYFNLLRNLFTDITDTILDNRGEIYQYVGDEIVISWPVKEDKPNDYCVKCFLDIKSKLIELGPSYMKDFGVIPEFKAGIHHGEVIAGEVGVVKKDIVYSGDVLNTTARIQELCNKYKVDILVSEDILKLLPNVSEYRIIPLGSIELRGKEVKVHLNTIETSQEVY